jgi:hypothetical protein
MSDKPFYVKHEILTDKSELYEIRCRGVDQRIGSSSHEYEATMLANALNNECALFTSRTAHNTIDAG